VQTGQTESLVSCPPYTSNAVGRVVPGSFVFLERSLVLLERFIMPEEVERSFVCRSGLLSLGRGVRCA